MSLADGLARALIRYTKAKNHFGLRNLLLGSFDLAELDRVQRGLPANRPLKPRTTAHLTRRPTETATASRTARTVTVMAMETAMETATITGRS